MKKLILLLMITLMLLSCTEKESVKDTIDIALSQEMPTLDVHKNSSQVIRYILCGNTLERFIDRGDDSKPYPLLAESYEMLDGGRKWVFTLRKGVTFHNGREMDAEDVTLSLNRWIDNYAAIRKMCGESRFVSEGDRVSITFDHPVIFLDQMMAESPYAAVIIARESLENTDENGFLKSYIGTGPYRFVSYEAGVAVTLDRYEGYEGIRKAEVKRLVYHFVPESAVRTLGCETGTYDFMNDVMSSDFSRLRANEDVVLSLGDETGSFVLLFNKRGPLAGNREIRKAVNTALDLEGVMKACYGEEGFTLNHGYMEAWQELWPNREGAYGLNNKAEAGKILSECGYAGETFTILTSNLSNMDKAALFIKSELEKAGMKVELLVTDWSTMMAWRGQEDKYDLCITAMTAVPLPSLKLFFDPTYAGWSDDEHLQELLSAFSESESYGEAAEIWDDIQAYCEEYLPVIVAGHYNSGYLYRSSLEGVKENNGFYFYDASFRN